MSALQPADDSQEPKPLSVPADPGSGELAAGSADPRARFRQGIRDGVPFAIAGLLVSASFGVVAQDAGFSPLASIVMSAIVFAGSAQFAAVAVLTAGGTAGAAIGAAALMNSRFLPMGAALGPSLPGGALKRALQGQTVVDASWAMSARGDGTFDRWQLFGATSIQYVTWSTGTAIGALAGDAIADPDALGLDAVYPTFFLALLVTEVRSGRALGVAALGAAIALVLVPVAPGGVPVLVASLAALLGLTRGAREDVARMRRDPARAADAAGAEDGAGVSTTTVVIAGCAVGTFLIKASGPVLLGGRRELPLWAASVIVLVSSAVLAALVVTSALAEDDRLTIGAETAGVAAGGALAIGGRSIVTCVVVAAAVTAGLRALGV